MKRIATALLLIVALLTALFGGVAAGGVDGGYEVRAIFDNGGFLTKGEEVRVAGAKVGSVAAVDVTDNDERARANGDPDPGKAVVVMSIEDPAFQDFREDASCLIRPQSLLGEKFVECSPTEPRAAGSKAPPSLAKIPDGQPGAGQYFLPLESNGKAVDLDLVNNIQRLPYAERFRLILNDLGAAFAGRGKDLGEVLDRSDPALRATDEVLAKIASQNRRLSQLARDGDAALTPLAKDRDRITGFLANANQAAAATADHKPALEAGFQKLPGFLRELRLTMVRLRSFADQSQPAFADLGEAAPAATRATKALGPFSRAGIPALTSLGDAAEQTSGPLNAADPVLRQLRDLSKRARPGTKSLNSLLRSTRKTDGFKYIDSLLFNTTGAINGYDSAGHILRTILPNNNCISYESKPTLSCGSNFGYSGSAAGRLGGSAIAEMFRQQGFDLLRQRDALAAQQQKDAAPVETDSAKAPGLKGVEGLLDYVYGSDSAPTGEPGTSSATPGDSTTAEAGSAGGAQ
ncbi:hypothetical protein BH10ACT11_BH10ACT11_03070 [soil metagenome]